MSDTVISLEKIVKSYYVYESGSQRVADWLRRDKKPHRHVMPLKGIDLCVSRGERVGIIGENGSGKSTLLRVIAGVAKPTSGRRFVSGSIASLLELGMGFHLEMTGRENARLNAELLGLDSRNWSDYVQAIQDFAELGEFFDWPLRTYSSGMQARLGFAVTVCMNADLLVVDEVLSVGDDYFRKKCVDHIMENLGENGTLIFCSHNLYQVQELCERVIWFHAGEIKQEGETGEVIAAYQDFARRKKPHPSDNLVWTQSLAPSEVQSVSKKNKPVRIQSIAVGFQDQQGESRREMSPSDQLKVEINVDVFASPVKGHLGFELRRSNNELCFGRSTKMDQWNAFEFKTGRTYTFLIRNFPLLAGSYHLRVYLLDEHALHAYDQACSNEFAVRKNGRFHGFVHCDYQWGFNPDHA